MDLSGALGAPTVAQRSTIGSAGIATTLPVADEVARAVATYESTAVSQALSGSPIDVSTVLTTAAARSLNANERATLTDEATVRAVSLQQDTNSVVLTGFAGPGGAIEVVDADLTLNVSGTTATGSSFSISRTGHLTFVNENGWRIDAFDLSVERDLP